MGTWTSYQLKYTDYSAPYTATGTIPSGYVGLRIKVEDYNVGNVSLGADTAYQSIGGGGKPPPSPD